MGHEAQEQVDRFNARETKDTSGAWDVLWRFAAHPILTAKLVGIFTTIQRESKMGNWKTTISGAIGAVAIIAKLFGLTIPDEVIQAIVIASIFFVGLFSKDATTPPVQ